MFAIRFESADRVASWLLGLLLALSVSLIPGCQPAEVKLFQQQQTSTAAPDPIQVETVRLRHVDSITIPQDYFGTVRPRRVVQLGFGGSGLITEIAVSAGTTVAEGKLLGRLQAESLQQTQQALQEALAENRMALQRVGEGESEMERIETRRQIDELWQQLNTVRDAASFPDSAANETTTNRLNALEDRIRDLDAESRAQMNASREQKRLEALNNIRNLEKQLRDTEAQLEQTKMIAPFDGEISAIYERPGNIVQAGARVLELQDRSSLQVVANLPRAVAETLKVDNTLNVVISDQTWAGTIQAIDPPRLESPMLQTVTVELDMPESNREILPGQTARLTVLQTRSLSGYWIPTSAMTREMESTWSIYTVDHYGDEAIVNRRAVDVLHSEPDRVLVNGELQAGQHLISTGTSRVVPGQSVRIVSADTEPSAIGEGETE